MTERFGEFEILRRLGVGGMAETFVARRVREGGFVKIVALKRVLPAYSDDPTFVRMFQREARLAARLEHPNVASVYDFGSTDGQWWMALELVEGIDLRGLLQDLRERGERLTIPLVVFIASEVASALEYAWERVIDGEAARIVHRDVTPSNVLIGYEGGIKLADFGVAKVALSGDATRTGSVYGKVPYMAPEQALGLAVDHRVDLFALGVMMFEMLAGGRPFDGATDLDTLQRIAAGRRAELGELAPDVPPALVRIVDHLLVPAREARLESAHALLRALADFPPPGVDARARLGELVRRARPPEDVASLAAARTLLAPSSGGSPSSSAPLHGGTPSHPAAASATPAPAAPPVPSAEVFQPGGAATPAVSPPAAAPRRWWLALVPVALAGMVSVAVAAFWLAAALPSVIASLGAAPPASPIPPQAGGAAPAQNASVAPEVAAPAAVAPQAAAPAAVAPETVAPEAAAPGTVAPAVAPGTVVPGAVAPAAAAPGAVAPGAVGPGAVAPEGGAAGAVAEAPDDPPPARDPDARLTIVVYPWGYVWIDGRARGRAPTRASLPPGEHVIGAGPSAARPTIRRRIQLAPGESRTLTLEVE